jgi:hypothetical protein
LIGFAVAEPNESTEFEGMVDLHWRFDNLEEAESVAEAMTVLCQRFELVFLCVSDLDDPKASLTFKDERGARR